MTSGYDLVRFLASSFQLILMACHDPSVSFLCEKRRGSGPYLGSHVPLPGKVEHRRCDAVRVGRLVVGCIRRLEAVFLLQDGV